jgi:hypothetical protein
MGTKLTHEGKSVMKPTLRALLALSFLAVGCAASIPQVDVETPHALQSVNGSSYQAAVHHDAPPSEQISELRVKAKIDASGQSIKLDGDDHVDTVQKSAHGF